MTERTERLKKLNKRRKLKKRKKKEETLQEWAKRNGYTEEDIEDMGINDEHGAHF